MTNMFRCLVSDMLSLTQQNGGVKHLTFKHPHPKVKIASNTNQGGRATCGRVVEGVEWEGED